MENIEKVYLENATRNQLIEELKSRESITHIHINSEEGAVVKSVNGSISVAGESNIFVIKPESEIKKISLTVNVDTNKLIEGVFKKMMNCKQCTEECDENENITTENSDVNKTESMSYSDFLKTKI